MNAPAPKRIARTAPNTHRPRALTRCVWLVAHAALIACAGRAAEPTTRTIETVQVDARDVLPLPDDLFSCTRHSDCVIAGSAQLVRSREDCERPPGMTAVNLTAAESMSEAYARICPPRPDPCACGDERGNSCCPPVAYRAPQEHAACVRSRCEIRDGADFTAEERREDAEGRGTDDPGECSDDSECQQRIPLTAFPAGMRDATGNLCPVCPRRGTTIPGETEWIASLGTLCPRRVCAPTTVRCEQRRCILDPERPARAQARALSIQVPIEPYTVPLPAGPDYACTSTAECVLAPLAQCSCGAVEPVNRAAAPRRTRIAMSIGCISMPCARPMAPDAPPPVPVCLGGVCTSRDMAQYARVARRARAEYARARSEFERALARARAQQALEEEIEEGGE